MKCPITEDIMEHTSDGHTRIDNITNDALLCIFSYLSILERAVVARVNRRWNLLVKQGELWKYIDLNRVIVNPNQVNVPMSHIQPNTSSDYYAELSNRETDTVQLIKSYLGRCLKEIHFHIPVTHKILRLLALRCPQLELIDIDADPLDVDLSLLSCKLVTIYLRLPLRSVTRCPMGGFAAFSLYRLTNLYLRCAQVTENLLCRLMQSPSLRNLALHGCHWQLALHKIPLLTICLPELTHLELIQCQFPSARFFTRLIRHISTEYVALESLEVIQPTSMDDVAADCSIILGDICECRQLQELRLGGIKGITLESVVHLSQALPSLLHIGLAYCHVTDDMLREISRGFMNMLSLDVSGCECISNDGLEFLRKHPSLQTLKLEGCLNLTSDNIVQTVISLPKIVYLLLPDNDYLSCQELLQSKKPTLVFLNII